MNAPLNSASKSISVLYRTYQAYLNRELKSFGLGSGQYLFLMHLYRQDGINQEELTAHVMLDKATTARALHKLVAEGYVERKLDPQDRRAYRLYLTERARQIQPAFQATIWGWNEIITAGLDEEQRIELSELLQQMSINALVHMQASENPLTKDHSSGPKD